MFNKYSMSFYDMVIATKSNFFVRTFFEASPYLELPKDYTKFLSGIWSIINSLFNERRFNLSNSKEIFSFDFRL